MNRTRFGKSDKEAVEIHQRRVGFVPKYSSGVHRVIEKSGEQEVNVNRDLLEVSVTSCDSFERNSSL